MSGPSGIVAVSRRELESFAGQGSGELAVRVYSTAEGLSTNQMNGVQPAGVLLPSGELWFPSTKGAVRIAAGGIDRRSAPPVLIEQVLADDHAVSFENGLSLLPAVANSKCITPPSVCDHLTASGSSIEWTGSIRIGRTRAKACRLLHQHSAGQLHLSCGAYEMDDPRNAAEQTLSIESRPHFYKS